MLTKICNKCKEEKNKGCFHVDTNKEDGLRTICKVCTNYQHKLYRLANPNKVKSQKIQDRKNNHQRIYEYSKNWELNNKDKVSAKHKRYYIKNQDILREKRRLWDKEHPENIKARRDRKMLIPRNRLRKNISCQIWQTIKWNKNGKHWEDIVGYKLSDLVNHLESKFTEGMAWNNYGIHGWHIDHIKPVAKFNFTSYIDREFKQCWCLANLQPLWAHDNLIKGAKYE